MFQPQYAWLLREKHPAILVQALKYYGTKEIPGPQSNPTILNFAKRFNNWISNWYKNDDIPWCGLFIGYVCLEAKLPVVKEPLRALAWAEWGTQSIEPSLGDLLIFKRGKAGEGHVGIYIGEDETCYHVLGGNQNNQVNITRIPKDRLFAARRTPWKIAKPANVKPIYLKGDGEVSENEA